MKMPSESDTGATHALLLYWLRCASNTQTASFPDSLSSPAWDLLADKLREATEAGVDFDLAFTVGVEFGVAALKAVLDDPLGQRGGDSPVAQIEEAVERAEALFDQYINDKKRDAKIGEAA